MKTYLLFILLAGIIIAAYVGQKTNRNIIQHPEYQFDVLTDSTILISGDNGDDWETISTDSLKEFIIQDNQ